MAVSIPEKTVLITGGTGFVGRALIRRLLEQGVSPDRIRCLVREPSRAAGIGLPHASRVAGSLEDPASLERAVAGASCVYHLAGATRALSRSGFFRVNRDGTRALLAAVRARAPDARVVLVSSLAATSPSVDGESSALPPDLCEPRSNYGASKRAAELEVQALGDAQPWVILRPPIVYGPRDDATRLLFRQALAPLAVVPWTRRPLSLMHVEDLARAIHLAGESPLSRRVLPLDGPNRLDTDSLIREIGRACEIEPRLFRVPLVFARALAPLCDLWAGLRRRPGFLCTDKLRDVAARGWVADPVPAREQLGFVPAWTTSRGFRDTALADGFVERAGAGDSR